MPPTLGPRPNWRSSRLGQRRRGTQIDHHNDLATLYFGHRDQYVITLGRDNLSQLVDLGAAAHRELATTPAQDQ
ncbi:MAG: hypothetical protein GEV28_09025 [Actinophytocola sp.]|uniref:hypothetical protein n=1 Tax=Actinophytocola sp. TaxID=1872138 RepID=UPI00132C95CA|nr:hypothetical protein [Actinophytocola sp.]MPZ80519.1 hypothetical protein [Actinophytocola sp.]